MLFGTEIELPTSAYDCGRWCYPLSDAYWRSEGLDQLPNSLNYHSVYAWTCTQLWQQNSRQHTPIQSSYSSETVAGQALGGSEVLARA